MLTACCMILSLAFVTALAFVAAYRETGKQARDELEGAKASIKFLNNAVRDWHEQADKYLVHITKLVQQANACSHRSAKLQDSMLDIMNAARAALEEVGKSTESTK